MTAHVLREDDHHSSLARLIRWERIYGTPPRVAISDEPDSPHTAQNLTYWLSHSDFYVFPHVQLFSSWAELLRMLRTADLLTVSRRMARFNAQQKQDLKDQWASILRGAVVHNRTSQHWPLAMADDFDEAMRRQWGVTEPLHADQPSKCR